MSTKNMTKFLFNKILQHPVLSAENQKGINTVQRCFIENKKGNTAIEFI